MRPRDEQELAGMIAAAKAPLRIVGGGTRAIGAVVCAGGEAEVLETSGLCGISLYEPGALTLVAGAGTPLAGIEAELAKAGQRLAFEVPDLRRLLRREGASTIGGVVAANASGPRRIQAGACRDSLLGVRFVDGRGAVIRNGGRVMKNVTGYDLVKLMAGARGTLGVLSEVALKVQPQPETEASLLCRGLGAREAQAAMARALGSPFEVTGAAYLAGAGEVRLRLEGMAASVAYRAGALAGVLGPGWDLLEAPDSRRLWQAVRDLSEIADCEGVVWRISVKPSDMPSVLQLTGGVPALCDWGGGLIWAVLPVEGDGGAARLRGALARIGGHATLMRGAEHLAQDVAVFQPETPALAAISAGLRKKFDPRGIFNPGLMA